MDEKPIQHGWKVNLFQRSEVSAIAVMAPWRLPSSRAQLTRNAEIVQIALRFDFGIGVVHVILARFQILIGD